MTQSKTTEGAQYVPQKHAHKHNNERDVVVSEPLQRRGLVLTSGTGGEESTRSTHITGNAR